MNTAKIRAEISEYLEHADERILKLIYGMIKADQSGLPAGYDAAGATITRQELQARAMRSEQDIKEGKVKSPDQIRKEMKNW